MLIFSFLQFGDNQPQPGMRKNVQLQATHHEEENCILSDLINQAVILHPSKENVASQLWARRISVLSG